MGEEVYEVSVECSNCGKEPNISIPKGMSVVDFFEQVRLKGNIVEPNCSYCGCRTLRAPLV